MKQPYNYKKASTKTLLKKFEVLKREWNDLPRRSSFSGLYVSGELDELQQMLEKRGVDFQPFYMDIYL